MNRRSLLGTTLATPFLAHAAFAADTVKVAVFNVSSALPFYVARERGFFAEAGIAAEAVPLQAAPLIVQAMVSGDVDGASNLVTLEGANINSRRANTAVYIALNGQSARYQMEQFVVRPGWAASSLKELKGARILSAPGPANMSAARAVLASVGLQEGRDYTLTEQQMGVHVGALAAGSFDAAYTLEPQATIAERQGAARRLEAGVIATHLIGRPDAQAWAAGAALTGKFLQEKPQVAQRFAAAWARACATIRSDASVRELLVPFMNTSAELAPAIPLVNFPMVKDMAPQDIADFQKFVDLAVAQGVVRSAIDVKSFLRPL
ncbi:NitT/TauT family transport system substrate-binding protein [Roseomonas rosea]|uniref:NitT/TauT family transport system substrate-binding protein n=1 Tax=Muricoccus roseus TaxID=198092 RepID=A0A1M6AME4_9PROT|nr:ABC transporter substrate-binding protein [Roseomonas rosea]SHI37632.1 NitT/TauT family transport system substrate-binding protein [Roseomonas rosea]